MWSCVTPFVAPDGGPSDGLPLIAAFYLPATATMRRAENEAALTRRFALTGKRGRSLRS